jgi:hypothetical protein
MKRIQAMQGIIAAALWHNCGAIAAATIEPYADPDAADLWMQKWMSQPHGANGMLSVERFADRYYYLTKKIQWKPDEPGSHLPTVSVPVGFVTDFASIPRVAWSILPPDGDYTYPAVVHDYLYWSQKTTREDADKVFQMMMKEFGIGASVITAIYTAVRAGGGSAWAENARLKRSGERRILRDFPTDPKTRWTIWKTHDVFVASQ